MAGQGLLFVLHEGHHVLEGLVNFLKLVRREDLLLGVLLKHLLQEGEAVPHHRQQIVLLQDGVIEVFTPDLVEAVQGVGDVK